MGQPGGPKHPVGRGRRGLSKPVRGPARDEANGSKGMRDVGMWEQPARGRNVEVDRTARRVCKGRVQWRVQPPESVLGWATHGDSDHFHAPIRKHCVLLWRCGSCALSVGRVNGNALSSLGWAGQRVDGDGSWQMRKSRCAAKT